MEPSAVHEVLNDPIANQLFDQTSLTRLAYTARDGSPRVVPIGFVWDGTHFVVCTSTQAAKVQSLTENPRVALTIDTDAFPPKVLLVRGSAALEVVDGIPEEFLQTNRRHTDPEQYREWEAGVRQLYRQMVRIAITPTWAKILDFETRLPSAEAKLIRESESR